MTVKDRIEQDDLFCNSAIVSHGFAPYMRDYDIVIEIAALTPDLSSNYIEGRYRYRFTYCPEVHVTSTVSDQGWQESWDDLFIDFEAWRRAGEPRGYIWGVCWASAFPGLSYVEDSVLAKSWSRRLGQEMHEVLVESNAHEHRIVCHDLVVQRIAVGDPITGELTPVEES